MLGQVQRPRDLRRKPGNDTPFKAYLISRKNNQTADQQNRVFVAA
jgi:hypothetical protein